jgi:hypothetical protein
MGAGRRTRRGGRALAAGGAALALGIAGCGEDDFENDARPPTPLQLTGVITEERVTVSPNKLGAGPIVLTVSNQTGSSHSLLLEGKGQSGKPVSERVGPVNPQDTATLQKTLEPGQYVVKAGSDRAQEREIRAATLVVGRKRDSASGELLLP